MTYFDQIVKVCEKNLSREEFFKVYNLYLEGKYDEGDKLLDNQYKNAAFTHLFVAYHTTYPERGKEYRQKKKERINKLKQNQDDTKQ